MVFIVRLFQVLLVLFLLRLVIRAIRGQSARTVRGPQATKKRPERIGGTLVRCDQCGTHVPQSKSVTAGAQTFCSEGCRDAFAAQRRAG